MLDLSDLKTAELLTLARQAIRSCAQRLEEISRASDPGDQPLRNLLASMRLEQDNRAEQMEGFEKSFADEPQPLSRSGETRLLIHGYLPSLTKRLGEGPLHRDEALFCAESLEEEASRLFRALAGHARESRVASVFSELSTWERDNVSYLREVLLLG